MDVTTFLAVLAFGTSVLCLLSFWLLYPLLLLAQALRVPRRSLPPGDFRPSVSVITIARNAEDLVVRKVRNSQELVYPSDSNEIIVYFDGPARVARENLRPHLDQRTLFFSTDSHEGKNRVIDRAVQKATGEIVVFTDVDAMLGSDAILKLVRHFADPEIGGVCGERVIREEGKSLKMAQSLYARFDNFVKSLESRVGSISSNAGDLFAVRRSLIVPLDPAVTDDLYIALGVVAQNHRFVYEKEARAYLAMPSRDPAHELHRRRRIVARSLRGIFLMRRLFNPRVYGLFSVELLVNKVLRRFMPLLLLLLFCSTLVLAPSSSGIILLLLAQLLFYLAAALYWLVPQQIRSSSPLWKPASVAFYFCLGNVGTFLGVLDFLAGKKVSTWEPVHADERPSSPPAAK